MQQYRQLKVWQRSHQLVLRTYDLTSSFPAEERFGLVSQLRRAAVSVPTNIAEGSKRRTNQDYARFLNMSEASLAETDYLLYLSSDLGYVAPEVAEAMGTEVDEISRMLYRLREKVERGA